MKINWKIRLKNKSFWIMLVPILFMLIEQILSIFGLSMNFMELEEEVLGVIATIFTIMGVLGVVMDPTTKGMSDSEQAMSYEEPKGKT